MMTPQEHAQLYRELAKYLEVPDIERGTVPAKNRLLATRARQAAEEIEGRQEPPDTDVLALVGWLKERGQERETLNLPGADIGGLKTAPALLMWTADLLARKAAEEIEGRRAPSPVQLAQAFHEAYERLAPGYGYETRKETRDFDTASPNSLLMVAVASELLARFGGGEVGDG